MFGRMVHSKVEQGSVVLKQGMDQLWMTKQAIQALEAIKRCTDAVFIRLMACREKHLQKSLETIRIEELFKNHKRHTEVCELI